MVWYMKTWLMLNIEDKDFLQFAATQYRLGNSSVRASKEISKMYIDILSQATSTEVKLFWLGGIMSKQRVMPTKKSCFYNSPVDLIRITPSSGQELASWPCFLINTFFDGKKKGWQPVRNELSTNHRSTALHFVLVMCLWCWEELAIESLDYNCAT